MSPPRRSKRIASNMQRSTTSPTPQLESLTERHEYTHQEPVQSLNTIMSSPMPGPKTPTAATSVKLPLSEMHPSKVHPTTAAPSSGLVHGFVDIDYTQKPSEHVATPSKTPVPSSAFTFRRARPSAEQQLGPEAQRMMEELREQAAKIKDEMVAQREQERLEEANANDGRKIARPKGKSSRFSAAHMAEFKKMDSIANHPSAFRATPGRLTTMNAGIKRSQSKANLDEPDSVRSKPTSARPAPKSIEKQRVEPESPTKRVRQRIEDDTSSTRPISRDGSAIPRPKSSGNDSVRSGIPRSQTHSYLSTPTKASLARSGASHNPTVTLVKSPSKTDMGGLTRSTSKPTIGGLTRSVSKPDLGSSIKPPTKLDLSTLFRSPSKKGPAGLTRSHTTNNLETTKSVPTHVQTPGRFDRVKSILKRHVSGAKSKSNIPHIAATTSKTIGYLSKDKDLPPIPLTTPSRGLERRVDFTPETKRASSLTQDTPSPVKSSIPRSKTTPKLLAPRLATPAKIKSAQTTQEEVSYPDLSAYGKNTEGENEVENDEDEDKAPEPLPQSVPGTFTFRSDHTIRFDSLSPKGFGSAAGQASLRQVRKSTIMSAPPMPGSFPPTEDPASPSPNKENKDPAFSIAFPHGMSNKKRHRATWDEEDEDEGAKRGMKKLRKDPPPAEGDALIAPRLLITNESIRRLGGPSRGPSPQKKKGGLSLSRLNMLAQPKIRK
ncbi:hypothetical protein F4778DRAFT_178628 [Xylariomycetidae sp. FL2044]|nr:hypothetical protein F4778DRAFT_178628 [Xylariomycetidae sp. FL2044]